MGTFKTVSEVVKALGEKYSGPTKAKNGFTYVEWHESVRQLDAVFGPFGWSTEVVSVHADTERGIYTTVVRVRGKAVDDEGCEVELVRDGVGVGIVTDDRKDAHDTAIKGSASDGLSRASKLLGDAFGLFLYQKENQRSQSGSAPKWDGAAKSNGSGTGAASEKQAAMMRKDGWTDEAIRGLSREQVREVMDGLFDKGPHIAPPAKQSGDDIPF